MNVKNQILIDKYIAKPIAYFLNFIVQILGQILRINHDLDKSFETIAVCKFKGMGSIIQATPLLNSIRKKHPNATIIFVTSKSNTKILEHLPMIDQVITVNDKGLVNFSISAIKALIKLIKIRPDVYIDLEIYSDFSTLFTLFTLSKNRLGFYLRSSSFRTGIYTHMMFFNPKAPISKVYLQMAKLLYCDDISEIYPLKYKSKFYKSIGKEYIVINPNASDLRIERRWDIKNFIKIIELLLVEYSDLKIVIVGSKDELDYTKEIEKIIKNERLINSTGKLTIDDLIGVIANAKLMLSNDTGPMHIAFSTETPIICLFGPCSPDQYGLSEKAHIIYKPVYCSPCVHDFTTPPCNGENICMKLIQVGEVYSVFKKINFEIHQNPKFTNSNKLIYSYNDNTLGILKTGF
ncbi:MAG: glycosyltransferase family 9 protein [Flavobacteriia bacterium]|nr:glycosyltransferase family 9 protein [Flavobacteriia bacterium]